MKNILVFFLLLSYSHAFSQSSPTDTIKSRGQIFMVGNSITFQGDWKKILKREDIVNWGIPGYTTEQISWTVKNFLPLNPTVCFLEGGINDITLGIAPDRVFANQVKVLDTLLAHGIIPVVQSTIYQNNSRDKNARVKEINGLISTYCTEHHIDYIDLNAVLSDADELKKEFTMDGTHLFPPAYALWADLVLKELEKLKL